jgi:hypothetical protein
VISTVRGIADDRLPGRPSVPRVKQPHSGLPGRSNEASKFGRLPAKLATELILGCLSYAVQSRFVFASVRRGPVEEPARPLQRR